MKKYSLVRFIVKGRKPEERLRPFDIILTSWLHFEGKKVSCFFPEPPYDDETSKNMNECLENMSEPPNHWPRYNCEIVGRAGTILHLKIFFIIKTLIIF